MTFATISVWSTAIALLQVLGSLGIFLYGMKIMSEGVQKVAGNRMRAALSGMTSTRTRGVLTGFFTTTLVQSSSATTVLVVSFANAGLLSLMQAIPVIMGANLGTTTTAWIVALIGKFSVSKIALPVIGIGLPLFFAGKDKVKSRGEALIGFGLVFLGLGLLKDSVPDLKMMLETDPGTAQQIESIIAFLGGHGFGSVFLFMLAGIVLTLLVQSSSAAMAITITCALNGWFGDITVDPLRVFQYSAAIVLGENIGTTVTAWLASAGANANAKRAARAHFTFNVIGVIWCLVLFYPFTSLVWGLTDHLPQWLRSANKVASQSEIAFATAIFHSTFNFVNILALVWFVPQIERFVTVWVKEKEAGGKTKLRYMGSSLVDIGELSLAEADIAAKKMADLTYEMFDGMLDVFGKPGEDLSARVAELKNMEDICDEMLHDITSYLIQCSTHEIGSGNASHITSLLRVVAELEEATDRIYRMVKVVQRKYEKSRDFTEIQHDALIECGTQVRLLINVARNSLVGIDGTTHSQAQDIENRVDRLRKSNNKAAAKRMQEGATVQTEMIFIDLNNHLEAVANHMINVIETASKDALSR
ncbi:MAG: Na/Pi cotransporter family protein [Akkermansiaceae bacterium]|nr:Na/Pi cotransporter family protein [Akkermansiaceae bacterium]MDP4645816.1 Na/Pi cotransporter family protein [Akkermansiaceae bacterium]MDP4720551.1 Na/Pi cotransporter family protein [Akkermansiaceae bacterium]MDP4779011.1 Na/Pi cotransporter family protein [Akkermansiaceae bacterium]MDP4847985.1 Na/Pi cotransporter family protein [Akkermansiaceae bacterium]